MRPIRTKNAPTGIMPRRFLISTLRQLGLEVGVTVPVLAPPGGARALTVRVHVYREGQEVHRFDATPDPRRAILEIWQHEWEPGPGAAGGGEDLIAIEYLHGPDDAAWLAPRMAVELEGQFLHRAADGRYGYVLTSFVPCRPPGYKFTPIIGLTHYHKFGPEWENYTLLVNLQAVEAGAGANRLHVDYYGFDGGKLAQEDIEMPFNASRLLRLEQRLPEAVPHGVTAHTRGGASQFSIFTLIRNVRTGAVGIEHSLPPYYYVTGISHPAIRVPFYQRALTGA